MPGIVDTNELGTALEAQPAQPPPDMLIVFRLGELRLGIDIRQVREVARELPLQAPLANAGGVAGMITLRGVSTAVVDLAAVLGVPRAQRDGRTKMLAVEHNGVVVCLLVDQIDGLHHIASGHLEPPPPILGDVDVRWLDYVTRTTAGEMVGVVDVDRILSQLALAERNKGVGNFLCEAPSGPFRQKVPDTFIPAEVETAHD